MGAVRIVSATVDNYVNNCCGEDCRWTGIRVTRISVFLQPGLALQHGEATATGMLDRGRGTRPTHVESFTNCVSSDRADTPADGL